MSKARERFGHVGRLGRLVVKLRCKAGGPFQRSEHRVAAAGADVANVGPGLLPADRQGDRPGVRIAD